MGRKSLNITEIRNRSFESLNSEKNVLDEYKDSSLEELKNITAEKTFPFWVMTLNVLGDLNVSTVIRSAHLYGAEKVVIFGRRRIDNRGHVGAAHYTPVERVLGLKDVDSEVLEKDLFIKYCNKFNVVPIFIEQGGQNCYEYSWITKFQEIFSQNKKPMFVLGTEQTGVPSELLDTVTDFGGDIISIPQRGVIRSHNLSMAFATVTGLMLRDMRWY
jgi:tRNA G18 (ribose-2'-O)-methylase SpoU